MNQNVTKESIIRVANDFIMWCRHKYNVSGHEFENPILRELSSQLEVWENGGAEDELPKWHFKALGNSAIIVAVSLLGILLTNILIAIKVYSR